MRLLVTRPEPDNARTAAILRARGHDVALAPLLRIESSTDVDLGLEPWMALLLTSANGARAAMRHRRRDELLGLPVLAVGRASAEAARATGFTDIVSADGDAEDLARIVATRLAGARRPLLHLAGEDRSSDLAAALAPKGIEIRTVTAYRAVKVATFPSALCEALAQDRIDGVLHFSRRTVEAYIECGRSLGRQALAPVHYCLSARIAEPLRQAGAGRIEVAARPDEASLLALVAAAAMPAPRSNRLE